MYEFFLTHSLGEMLIWEGWGWVWGEALYHVLGIPGELGRPIQSLNLILCQIICLSYNVSAATTIWVHIG